MCDSVEIKLTYCAARTFKAQGTPSCSVHPVLPAWQMEPRLSVWLHPLGQPWKPRCGSHSVRQLPQERLRCPRQGCVGDFIPLEAGRVPLCGRTVWYYPLVVWTGPAPTSWLWCAHTHWSTGFRVDTCALPGCCPGAGSRLRNAVFGRVGNGRLSRGRRRISFLLGSIFCRKQAALSGAGGPLSLWPGECRKLRGMNVGASPLRVGPT